MTSSREKKKNGSPSAPLFGAADGALAPFGATNGAAAARIASFLAAPCAAGPSLAIVDGPGASGKTVCVTHALAGRAARVYASEHADALFARDAVTRDVLALLREESNVVDVYDNVHEWRRVPSDYLASLAQRGGRKAIVTLDSRAMRTRGCADLFARLSRRGDVVVARTGHPTVRELRGAEAAAAEAEGDSGTAASENARKVPIRVWLRRRAEGGDGASPTASEAFAVKRVLLLQAHRTQACFAVTRRIAEAQRCAAVLEAAFAAATSAAATSTSLLEAAREGECVEADAGARVVEALRSTVRLCCTRSGTAAP